MDLESCSLCICAPPPYPELLLPRPRQVSKLAPFRNPLSSGLDKSLLFDFYCNRFHGFCFSICSFFLVLGVSCPRAGSPKVFQVDRLTIGGGDKDKMIPTAVKTNHCSDRAGQRNANTSYFLKVSLNESSAGIRGIFKTCQHDWLSLPFCTLSPNHRVAVAKSP